MKIFKKILIGAFASIIIFANSIQAIQADNTERFSNDDGSVNVSVEKITHSNKARITMTVDHLETISSVDILIDKVEINKGDNIYDISIEENGVYSVKVTYNRTVNLESEMEGINREEHYSFNISVNDIDDSHNRNENESDEIDDRSEGIEIVEDEFGKKTINKIPELNDLGNYLNDDEMILIDSEKGILSIVKNTYTKSNKSSAYATNSVSMGNKVVQAGDTVTVTWRENRSYYWVLWGGISELFVDNNRAYCLEPSILERVATGNAYSTSLSSVEGVRVHPDGRLAFKPTSVQKRNIELIANYGYQYPGHSSTKFEWATKKMIWNEMGWDVDGGPNVDKETKEIQGLINSHNTKPSFDGSKKKVKIGQIVDLSEEGLENFSVNHQLTNGMEIVESSGNILKVKITKDKANLVLDKILGSKKGTSLVYTDGASQKVAHLKIADPISVGISFVAEKHKQRVKKTGVDGEALSGHIFRMSQTNKVDSNGVLKEGLDVTTNQDGYSEYVEFDDIGVTIYVQEIAASKPYIRDLAINSFVVESGKIETMFFTNEKAMGQIKIIKSDISGSKNIEGAQFQILDSNKNVLEVLTTDSKGEALSSHLNLGLYYAKEIYVPSPYIIDTKLIEFKLEYQDQSTPLVLKVHTHKNNTAMGQIEILKETNHGDFVEGVVFEILNSNNTKVETIQTNKDGKAYSSKLPLGLYYVRETKTVEGLVLDPQIYTVKIDYIDQVSPLVIQRLNIVNKHQRGNIKLIKVENDWDKTFNENNGKVLSGAKVQLFAKTDIYEGSNLIYAAGQLVGSQESDENGIMKFNNLPIGSYFAKETKSPEGYILFNGDWNILIKYDVNNPEGELNNFEMEISNQVIYGKASLVKTNGSTKLLEGAKFGVFTNEGEKIVELISDKRGIVETPNLRFGSYYLQEIEAPIGFWLDNEKIHFEIDEHEQTLYLTKSNASIEAKIKVKKIDGESSQPLEGVGFKIIDSNNEIVKIKFQDGSNVVEKDEWFTNNEGVFVLEAGLPYGKYMLIETLSAPGYKPIEPINFVIDENQDYLNLEVIGMVLDLGEIVNERIYADLVIKKIDEKTGLPIADTHFEIFDHNMELIKSLVTDKEGFAILSHVPFGMYHVVEIAVPSPYVIIEEDSMKTIYIEEDSKTYELVFSNVSTSISVSKIAKESGLAIQGTVFNLLDSSKHIIDSGTTDEYGNLLFEGILPGLYYIEEEFVPYPYYIETQELIMITISKENNHQEVVFENKQVKGNLEIGKLDSKTNKPLSGVKFALYSLDNLNEYDADSLTYNLLKLLVPDFVGISDEQGNIEFRNLDIGTKWILIELENPYGYEIDETLSYIEFDYDNCFDDSIRIKKDFYNNRSKVIIKAIKMNKLSNLRVSSNDFKLILKDSQGYILDTAFVDENGVHYWEVDALELYYLSEEIAPKGYLLSDEIIVVDTSVVSEDDIYVIEYFNVPETKILVGIKEKPPVEILPEPLIEEIPEVLPFTGIDNSSLNQPLLLIIAGLLLIVVHRLTTKNKKFKAETVLIASYLNSESVSVRIGKIRVLSYLIIISLPLFFLSQAKASRKHSYERRLKIFSFRNLIFDTLKFFFEYVYHLGLHL